MKKAFGRDWRNVFREEPHIDERRWDEVGHLAKKKWKWVAVKNFMIMMPPMTFLIILQSTAIMEITFDYFLYLIVLATVSFFVTILYIMKRMKDYTDAVKMKAKKDMSSGREYTVVSDSSEEDDIELDKFLKMNDSEWRDVEEALSKERPYWYGTMGSIAVAFIFIISGLNFENIIFEVVGFAIIGVIMVAIFRFNKLSEYRSLVNNAVEHELKTGEIVLPEDFVIPEPIMGGDYVKRDGVTVTQEEREMAEKWSSEMYTIGLMIGVFVIVMVMMVSLLYFDITDMKLGMFLFLGGMMTPMLLFGLIINKKQKVVSKVNQAEKIEEFLEEER